MPIFGRSPNDDTPNAVVGAARKIHLDRRSEVERIRERGTQDWQRVAWRHYDEIGEIKFAFNYFAAVASRIRLFAGYQDEASDKPGPIGEAEHLTRSFITAARHELGKLNAGVGGQPNLIRQFVLNLLVPGEVYLVGAHGKWSARSTSELRWDAIGRPILQSSRLESTRHYETLDPDTTYVARVWRTHPQYSDDADSSLRGVQNDCSELLLLSRLIRASTHSRLNAGMLFVADEMRFRKLHDAEDDESNPDADPFEEELYLTLTDPRGDTDSPSEVMPMIVRAPAALAKDAIQHITLGRDIGDNDVKERAETLQRVLNGLDIPKDIITGLAGVRYSNARTITEDLYKSHVEPMIVLICEALTTVFLRPAMLARGYQPELVDRLHVWYDPSEVVVKPDRSEDADKGYEKFLISGKAWRRSHGFSEADGPSDEELVRRIALGGTVAPSTTLEFMRAVAPEFVKHAETLAREAFGGSAPTTEPPTGAVDAGTEQGDSYSPTNAGSTSDGTGDGTTPADSGPPTEGTPGGTGGPSEPPEGSQPPAESAVASVDGREDGISSSQVLEMLQKLTDASSFSYRSSVVVDREKRLHRALDVDRRMRESMHSHLGDVVMRAVHRAGARTVSKVRGDAELKTLVSDVPMEAAFSAVPESRRAEFGLNARKLVEDTVNGARENYVARLASWLRTGWRALSSGVADALEARLMEAIEASWTWLRPKLIERAEMLLDNPESAAQPVTMDIIREATARAGNDVEASKPLPPSSPTTAVLSTPALDATGWGFDDRAFVWVYGMSENGFEPHERLDGSVFGSWKSDDLKTPGGEKGWPYVTHWFPGDHAGCRCDVLPVPLDPETVDRTDADSGPSWIDRSGPADKGGEYPVAASTNGHRA